MNCLEFQRVSGGVVQKERGLLADRALEANVRLDLEAHASRAQPLRQRVPVRPCQNNAEMRDRNFVAVDGVRDPDVGAAAGVEMRNELMAE